MPSSLDNVTAAFDRTNLVALGECHWAREDADFRLQLIRTPAFAEKVNDIVIEFGNPLYQAALDRFMNGEDVPPAELRNVWRNTTQPGAWDSPVYEEFIVAVRSVNANRPPGRRLRLLAADYPIDWSESEPAQRINLDARDQSAAAVIAREVLAKDRKALVLFGSAHLYRNRPGTIVELLKHDSRARWFIVVPVEGPDLPPAFSAIEGSAHQPALLALAGDPLGDIAAAEVLERGTKRIKVVDGKRVSIPVFETGIKLRELADACLYFGNSPPNFVEPSKALYAGTEYGREIERRRKIILARY